MGIAWNLERIKSSAESFEHRSEWRSGDRLAYNAAQRQGVLDEVCEHMGRKPAGRPVEYTPDRIRAESKKYHRMVDLKRDSPGAYAAARRSGMLEEIRRDYKKRSRVIEAAVSWARRNDWADLSRQVVATEAGCSLWLVSSKYEFIDDLKAAVLQIAVDRRIAPIVMSGHSRRHPIAMAALSSSVELRDAVNRYIMRGA